MNISSKWTTLAMLLALGAPLTSMAADDAAKAGAMSGMQMNDADALSSGEVKKIDKEAVKITIKHGPLTNLGMPAMTMVFRVQDPAMLDQVKQGDQINFVAEKANGALTVTKIEAAK
jgi:Cu(I)/Ag(I) efflux system protein CusF